jgi:hypothetical protein
VYSISHRATALVPRGFSLASHTPTHKSGFSPRGMLFLCAATILATTPSAHAQTAPCGLSSIAYKSELVYPPIAKLAHIEGIAVLMVRFDSNGSVDNISELSGNRILLNAAATFARGASVNAYSGPRECPIIITFRLTGPGDRECDSTNDIKKPPPPSERIDLQHVLITAENICLYVIRDPSPMREHHFFFHRWYSKS